MQEFSFGYPKDPVIAPKPEKLNEMLELSTVLCKDFEHVRVDWYNLPDGRVLFGEMTFTSWSGLRRFKPDKYDDIFGKLIKNNKVSFGFQFRSKRPPLDPVNAVLSFVYTLATSEFAAALETVGLDSYIGFCHTLRSGRSSLACDLVEETRCIVERFVLTLLNLQILNESDFEKQVSGAVWLNEDGRKKVLSRWQEKREQILCILI